MRLMAAMAAISAHGIRMGKMAVLTGLDLSMKGMTGRAGQFAVNARVGLQLSVLLFMTAQAGRGEISGKADLQGLMGIGMTG